MDSRLGGCVNKLYEGPKSFYFVCTLLVSFDGATFTFDSMVARDLGPLQGELFARQH